MAETESYTTEQITAFKDAVSHVVPAAVAADVSTLAQDGYEIGRVLVYQEKPKAYISWRKSTIDFARDADGKPLELFDLLSQADRGRVSADKVRKTRRHFTSRCGEEFVYQIDPEAHSSVKLGVDLGSVVEVSSNLYAQVNSVRPQADTAHPAVKTAVENGGVLMVVSTVYQSDRACIELGKIAEDGKAPQWTTVYASPRPTNIAYLLLKLKIGDDGVLTPMLNMGLTPVSLAKVNIDILKRMTSVTKAVPPQIKEEEPLDAPEAAVVIASGEDDVDFASGKDDVDFGDHFHCGSRDFQVFHSTSYGGVIGESSVFVQALVENAALQKEFLQLVAAPQQRRHLDKLIGYLNSVQEAVRLQETKETVCPPEVQGVIGKISQTLPTREEEIKALLTAAEAFKEFTPSAMKIIVELSPPRRDEILQLIKQLPFGSTRHVFTRESFPDSDLVYYQFLRKMGFGDSAGHLEFTGDADTLELLGAGLTAVLASKTH